MRSYPSCPGYVAELDFTAACEWLDRLLEERERYGGDPQLDTNIEDAQHHIERLALSAWVAACSRDDELCMYLAGQQMAAALRRRLR